MLNIFEKPWLLAAIGFWLTVAVFILARFWPLKFTRKHLLLGPALIALGFALDYLVVTDREKIETIMSTLVKATQHERAEDIIQFIAPNYHDRAHTSRESFSRFCRYIFSQPQIDYNWVTDQQLELDRPQAKVWITARTRLDEANQFLAGVSVIETTWELGFRKQPDKSWLIETIEWRKFNGQPVDWTVMK